jgi:hypothetical protein
VDRSSAIAPDRPQIVIPYESRFRDRRVLLHVSILMTFGDFGRRSNIGSASRTRLLNSVLFLKDQLIRRRQNHSEVLALHLHELIHRHRGGEIAGRLRLT